jgi:AcrR family transcriptional regulator
VSIVFAFVMLLVHSGGMTTTRRDRLRASTIVEIKSAALDQIASSGASGLSMRGIARRIGMSPAGLYRYYEGLDELLTDLIADAYEDLADAVWAATSSTGSTRDRMGAGMLAYREWCVLHPNRFLLIFGTPIPGYAAPEGGPTVEGMRRVGEAFFTLAAEAWEAGEFVDLPLARSVEPAEVALASGLAADFPPDMVSALLSVWAHFHGIVTLEILHQLDWLYPDPGTFYLGEVERMLDRLAPGDAT